MKKIKSILNNIIEEYFDRRNKILFLVFLTIVIIAFTLTMYLKIKYT